MNEQKQKKAPTLEEIYKLTKDNNRMLRAMRREAFIGRIVKFVFWIAVFFILPYILYTLYLEPYLQNIQATYNSFNESAGTLNAAAEDIDELRNQFPDFGEFFNQFGGGG